MLRDLYETFRDGLIDDAMTPETIILQGGLGNGASPWKFMPRDTDHVGRMQTMALIRRFMVRACKEFPGGVVMEQGRIQVAPHFILFIKTHREMGTSMNDMIKTWEAMSSVTD